MSANKIFGIIEEKSLIDVRNPKGEMIVKEGAIEFRSVDFKYPTR